MEHVAIDLGRPNSVLCELGPEGKKVLRRFRLDKPNLTRFFSGRPACRVLIESSTESEWVARHAEGLGHEVVVADPNYAAMYGERNRRVKTDGRDADALFEANRLGVFRLTRGCRFREG
jgi:transposase